MKTKYFHGFDLLRGLAAFSVFFSHAAGMYNIDKPFYIAIFSDGHAAVILFFVLSGFVLTYNNLFVEKFNLINFITKRLFRIYPMFIVSICIAFILKEFFYNELNVVNTSEWFKSLWDSQIDAKLFFQTILMVIPNFNHSAINPVIWTLIVEVYASFILPLFIVVLRKNLFYILIFTILLFLSPYIFNIAQLHYFFIFYIGSLYAKYFKEINTICIGQLKNITIIAVAMYLFGIYKMNYNFIIDYFISDYIIAMGSIGLMIVVVNAHSIINIASREYSKYIGKISYSFYLLHFPILLTLVSLLSNTLELHTIIIISFISTLFVSKITFEKVELRGIQLGKKIITYVRNKRESV